MNRSNSWSMLLFFLLVHSGWGFSLTPTSMEFDPAGRGATRTFRIENKTDQPAAIQISMLSRTMDLDGKETYTNAESFFMVFPPQVTVKPGQAQKISVRWIGPATLTNEIPFRMLAEQLPIAMEKEQARGANVKMVLRYLAAIYIVPKDAKPDVVVESLKPLESGQLEVILHNRGQSHTLLHDAKLHFTCEGQTDPITYNPDDLKGMSGENMLAGNRRRFRIPIKEGMCTKPAATRLEFLPVR